VDAYLERRYTLGIPCELANPLRATPGGRPRSLGSVQAAVTRLMKSIGLKSATGRGPRVYDLRHTFAVHRVEQWYRDGHDVQSLLPHLAAYMGHRGLESTQYYLWLTPDVLHAAADRFRLLAQQTANAGGEP
jgi:integrase/recombinase XerD